MAFTLVLVSKLDKANCSISFTKGICTIKNPTRIMMAKIPRSDGLYQFSTPETSSDAESKKYCTYQSKMESVTIENGSDKPPSKLHYHSWGMLAEGEKDKVIQTPENVNKTKDILMPPGIECRNQNNHMRNQSSTIKANKVTTKVVKTLEEAEEIILDIPLSQMTAHTVTKRIPATRLPPKILYRLYLDGEKLPAVDKSSRIPKNQRLRSHLDKIGWWHDKLVIIDCNGQVAKVLAKENKSQSHNPHTNSNFQPIYFRSRDRQGQGWKGRRINHILSNKNVVEESNRDSML